MGLPTEKVAEIVKKHGKVAGDSGSAQVQIALLTARLEMLNEHFKQHKKDHHSRRGLLKLVGQRRKLLRYLSNRNQDEYKKLIGELGIRR